MKIKANGSLSIVGPMGIAVPGSCLAMVWRPTCRCGTNLPKLSATVIACCDMTREAMESQLHRQAITRLICLSPMPLAFWTHLVWSNPLRWPFNGRHDRHWDAYRSSETPEERGHRRFPTYHHGGIYRSMASARRCRSQARDRGNRGVDSVPDRKRA